MTGAGAGLGRAIVDGLSAKGWEVWATDRDETSLDVSDVGATAVMDVTDRESVAAVMDSLAAVGGVDAVVNNAGICELRSWQDHDAALMQALYNVNVVGTMQVSQAAAEQMIDHGRGGVIVNIVSIAAYKGFPTGLAYAASKGALISLTRSMAIALGPLGIRVNAVAPGFMETATTRRLVRDGMLPADRLTGADPDRRMPGTATAAKAASVVAAMLDPSFEEVTGQVIAADGGAYFI